MAEQLVVLVAAFLAWQRFHPSFLLGPAFARQPTVFALTSRRTSRAGFDGSSGLSLARRTTHTAPPRTIREARARGWRDPLAAHRAVVGPEVRTSFLIRIRAVIALLLIIAVIGAAIAAVTLLVIASGRFLLESLAG